MRSLTVLARNPLDGLFYRGYVATPIKTLETKHVEFDFISPQDVDYKNIICIGGAIPWPDLQPGDTVLVRVFNRPSGIVNYVPGTVLHLPNNCHGRKYFTVLIYTCNQVFTVSRQRKDLIKIGREQHKEILDYIFLIRSKSSKKPASEPGARLYLRRERRCNPIVFVNLHPLKEKSDRSSASNEPEKPKPKPDSEEKTKSESAIHTPSKPLPPKPPSPKPFNTTNDTVIEQFEGLKFKKNQVVLARWKDDGWYYYGKYQFDTQDGLYHVMDRTGYSEDIQADDIIVDEKYIFQPRDTVVALHKEHVFSYAPGKIDKIYKADNSEFARVEFYDGTVRDVPIKDQNCEMFKLDLWKYQQVVEYIKECEVRVVQNGSAVARYDDTGFFSRCTVKSHTTQSYIVSFNGELKEIPSVYLFHHDRETSRDIKDWKCALVPTDVNGTKTYVPAKVESHSPITVKLCTQEEPLILHNFDDCFYINETFYTNSVAYINDRKARRGRGPDRQLLLTEVET